MKRFITILECLLLLLFCISCGSATNETTESEKSTNSRNTTEVMTEMITTTESTTTEADTEVTTEAITDDEPTEEVASKDDVKNFKPVTETGVFQGFADNHSVEIQMPGGSTQVFFVEDAKVLSALENCDENATIQFTYTMIEGQVNKVITKIN